MVSGASNANCLITRGELQDLIMDFANSFITNTNAYNQLTHFQQKRLGLLIDAVDTNVVKKSSVKQCIYL